MKKVKLGTQSAILSNMCQKISMDCLVVRRPTIRPFMYHTIRVNKLRDLELIKFFFVFGEISTFVALAVLDPMS